MNMLKLTAAAALVAASLSASAMTAIADQDLSAVAGQDGVSIAADLNINIGSFTYTDTDATGGSVSFNKITVTGMLAMTIDVLNQAAFQGAVGASVLANGGGADTALIVGGTAAALGYKGGDVVQFAFPAAVGAGASTAAHNATPTITVGSITTGNGGASFGSFQIKNMDLQGTTVWMFGH
ncbi:MAG: DUF6160 family protein [Betaproteobacteria bacterium]